MLVAAALICLQAQAADDPGTAAINVQQDVRKWVFDALLNKDKPTALAGQTGAMAGREDIAAKRERSNRATPVCEAMPDDPLDLIVREARKTSIVIINESHESPRDRYFIGKVLTALRSLGFDTYAGETLSQAGNLDHAGVLGSDGWYSNEPMFARTLLTARRLGYRLVPYERTAEQDKARAAAEPQESSINRREKSQTENLMAAIFSKQPGTRVVIHVGHSHVRERQTPDYPTHDEWMAERLKAATGIDALTIDQTMCDANGAATVIARNRKGPDGARMEGSPVDLYVGHPALAFREGRPEWRRAIGDIDVPVPGILQGRDERVMVEARRSGASLAEVPMDRVLLFPGEQLPLLLPPGRYRVDGFTAAGRIEVGAVEIEVR